MKHVCIEPGCILFLLRVNPARELFYLQARHWSLKPWCHEVYEVIFHIIPHSFFHGLYLGAPCATICNEKFWDYKNKNPAITVFRVSFDAAFNESNVCGDANEMEEEIDCGHNHEGWHTLDIIWDYSKMFESWILSLILSIELSLKKFRLAKKLIRIAENKISTLNEAR